MITRCGYVAIVGRPNVGKSTLLNSFLGQKVSITSRKPQTTRHKLLGIKTLSLHQILFVDTPGIHLNEPKAINRYMNKNAKSVFRDVDVILFLLDRGKMRGDDHEVSRLFNQSKAKKIIVINKIDLLENKNSLLPLLIGLQKEFPDVKLVPISAKKSSNLDELENVICETLPESPFYFDSEQLTDRSERFFVSEIIREKLMRQLGDELPYAITIQIEKFEDYSEATHIEATIFVEKESQKRILIGKSGEKLKRVGIDSRKEIEKVLGVKVMLKTWVKVKSGWSDNERAIRSLGYDDVQS